MAAPDEPTNGVRISNADIYRLLLDTNREVASVRQTVTDVLKPGLESARGRLDALEQKKADRDLLNRTEGRLEKMEIRQYAILAGLVAAAIGAKGLGLF